MTILQKEELIENKALQIQEQKTIKSKNGGLEEEETCACIYLPLRPDHVRWSRRGRQCKHRRRKRSRYLI